MTCPKEPRCCTVLSFCSSPIIPFSNSMNYCAELQVATVRDGKMSSCVNGQLHRGCHGVGERRSGADFILGSSDIFSEGQRGEGLCVRFLWLLLLSYKLCSLSVCGKDFGTTLTCPFSEAAVMFLTANLEKKRNKSRGEGENPACISGSFLVLT